MREKALCEKIQGYIQWSEPPWVVWYAKCKSRARVPKGAAAKCVERAKQCLQLYRQTGLRCSWGGSGARVNWEKRVGLAPLQHG